MYKSYRFLMNKIKQNKITFTLIIAAIAIIFSSLTILSLPVLFNYESKVTKIENNFNKKFKIYLNTNGKISYKPFPKPHLLVENASLKLSDSIEQKPFINKTNIKIFISLKDIYLRSFKNFVSTEISDTNLEFEISQLKHLRKHLYKNINNPIIFKNCIIFIKNKKNEVLIISPVKKILYKINKKSKIKNFLIKGKVFGINFKSDWKRNYETPKNSFHVIKLFNPKIEIKNFLEVESNNQFKGQTNIEFMQDKIKYNYEFDKNQINLTSPKNNDLNFIIDSKIHLKPFYFEGELLIRNKKVEKIIDNILSKLILYDEDYLGNFNGILKIKFKELDNKLIKSGELKLRVNEKEIKLNEAKFILDKIGNIVTKINFIEDKGNLKFLAENQLYIKNHIEFAKIFQVGSNKVKNIKQIYFDIEKNVGEKDFVISNVRINNLNNKSKSREFFLVSNIQNLRLHIRKIID